MRRTPQLVMALMSMVVVGCAGAGGGEGGGAVMAVGDEGCVVDRVPLTIGDGIYPYIEPENLIRLESGFVVVGTPTYTWAPGTDGDSLPVTQHQHLAARFTLDGRTTLIERPVADSIGSVRAVALGGERWGVLFDITRPFGPSGNSQTHSVWYAEHDGEQWLPLESVPIPEAERYDFYSSTELLRMGDDLVWVSVARPTLDRSQVLEYRRRDGAWRYEVISDAWIETSALAYDERAGLWLAHYATDTTFVDFRKTVRLLRRDDTGWVLAHRLADYPGASFVLNLAIRPAAQGVDVSWRVSSATDDGAYAVLAVAGDSPGTRITLDRRVLQVMSLEPVQARPRWLVSRVAADDRSLELRLLEHTATPRPEVVATTPSPYLAFLASLAISPSEALIVGPEVSSDPADPFVRSLLLRLSSSCS